MKVMDRRVQRHLVVLMGAAVLVACSSPAPEPTEAPAPEQTEASGVREVPAREVPVPDTVSPELQALIANPISDTWESPPSTIEEWQAMKAASAQARGNPQPLLDEFGVTYEEIVVNDVTAYLLTPAVIAPENQNRLLVHLHGGCYMMGGGKGAMSEGIMLAGYGRFRVLTVDYRTPPEHRFPAALDDAVAVWQGAMEMADPEQMAIFGASAGGGLTLSTVLKLKQEGLPLPAAIAPGTPMADLTKTSDSFYTNRTVDNTLIGLEGFCQGMAEVYAGGHDLSDPLLSPVNGDVEGFPPTLLTTGTRDLLLSDTVRVHRKLREAEVIAELHVYEGQAHGHYLRDVPEREEAFTEMARFFDEHLAE